MKVLIVDDELNIREGLKKMITAFCPYVSEIGDTYGVQSGLEAIKKEQPDLVLLDVELEDGTGMDLLSSLDVIDFQLVFITAHNKYAIDAFKFSAIEFLLKPIDTDNLMHALDKAKKQIGNENLAEQLQILKQSLNAIRANDKKIVLKDINSIYFVKVSDIVRCESDGQYTQFHLSDSQKILISKSLKEYEKLLEPYGFIRPHHSHLINRHKIVRFDKTNGGTLLMETNCRIPVSHRKRAHILQVLDNQQ
ncbi:LytR/AlgR family response regulator transcription factor [Hyunsoonleella rubra]|uniref:LytR/AlgR family response regulator transcription factor n=1 Tax=Hyunsoonleella rubra TaxID=1737062 RepID=A0ABW5TD52_9FLAO